MYNTCGSTCLLLSSTCGYVTSIRMSLAAHVFFDDAMELDDDEERVVNSFVKLLVSCMDEAAR